MSSKPSSSRFTKAGSTGPGALAEARKSVVQFRVARSGSRISVTSWVGRWVVPAEGHHRHSVDREVGVGLVAPSGEQTDDVVAALGMAVGYLKPERCEDPGAVGSGSCGPGGQTPTSWSGTPSPATGPAGTTSTASVQDCNHPEATAPTMGRHQFRSVTTVRDGRARGLWMTGASFGDREDRVASGSLNQ